MQSRIVKFDMEGIREGPQYSGEIKWIIFVFIYSILFYCMIIC